MSMGGYFTDNVETREDYDPDELDDYDFEVPELKVRGKSAASERMQAYFRMLEHEFSRANEVAKLCRARGLDPSLEVEIPAAADLAARCEELLMQWLPGRGLAERIREVAKEMNREMAALHVAKETAAGKFGEFEDQEKALDAAIRVGLAILTEGILVAPLEGIAGVRILQNEDGTNCAAVSYAGPIRAAGGTGQALSVLIADVVRRELGIGKYKPTRQEIERFKEEIPAYKMAANLQYTPPSDEIELIVKNCPIMIDGEGTEREEIGGNRDLPRIETNQIRGGACLVLAEGMTLKAPKIQKHVKALELEGWDFIDTFVNKGKKKDEGPKEDEVDDGKPKKPSIDPNPKFMADLIAGRPVFAGPMAKGGWRLRYGRSRTGGLATTAIHPAAMPLTGDFLVVGTQMKIERPGKATCVSPVDTVEPPIVRLRDGSLVEVSSIEYAKELKPKIERIMDLGEILIPFGEFAENNKNLPQSPWCEEWWRLTVEKKKGDVPALKSAEEAFEFARRSRTPLHPHWNLFWHDLTTGEIRALSAWLEQHGHRDGNALVVPKDACQEELAPGRTAKLLLEDLGCLHDARDESYVITRYAYAFPRGLGLEPEGEGWTRRRDPATVETEDPCEFVSTLAGVRIMPRSPCRIGTRMGRPEKAAERKMNPPVHTLFPIGQAGGAQRLMKDAAEKGAIPVEIAIRKCPGCRKRMVPYHCHDCGEHTELVEPPNGRVEETTIPLGELYRTALSRLTLERPPDVKAVQGLISRTKRPEPLEKGLLRAKHKLFTFKDGTVRFDMMNVNCTHFKPREAHASVEKLREMGYTHDVYGEPLERDDQILELRVQDIIVSTRCMDYMLRCSQYIDELLAKFYGYKPYYNCKTHDDLLGHMFVALAPHTSGGVLCRIIGHAEIQAHFGHPFFHAAKRRNADGDEDCVMLLLDGLLNFSRAYLPSNRGGLMDAPLTLTLRLDPSEVDKEAHNVDCMFQYPLEFYEATKNHPGPKEVEDLIDMVAKRLGTEAQYEGFGFTHDTTDIAEGPELSAYKTIGSMMDKMTAQLDLALKLRGVNAADVAARIIGSHFLPDLMGNLKAFSKQSMRCTKCNAKFRRVPLTGKCHKCGTQTLTMTVYQASVTKYLEVSKQVCEKYNVNDYVRQRIAHIEDSINSLFQNDRVKKAKLTDFF